MEDNNSKNVGECCVQKVRVWEVAEVWSLDLPMFPPL